MELYLHAILSLAAVLAAAQLGAFIFRSLGQPSVVGEITGGILLGPSLLGKLAPDWMHAILAPSVVPTLSFASQAGVLIYMFYVGLEFDLSSFRERSRSAFAIAGSSMLLPFSLGILMSFFLFADFSGGTSFLSFCLFCGISLSVTAFPVLARILAERNALKTRIGALALGVAALKDLAAWCLLALLTGVVRAQVSGPLFTWALSLVYILVMLLALRPWAARWLEKKEGSKALSRVGIYALFAGLALSAAATEWIGIHAIFGAFLFGAIVPHHNRVESVFFTRIERFARIFLLPAFFAITGMRTDIWLLNSASDISIAGIILLAAIAGKLLGASFAARFTGHSWRESATLAILLNTRGLVELIVLNVGLDLKVISPKLFAILVFMALFTTYMTGPLLTLVWKREKSSSPAFEPTSTPAGS